MRITQMTAQEVRIRAEHARDSLLTAQARFDPGGPMASNNTTGLNAVNAGIAAADAICGSKLGYRSSGQDHRQAIGLQSQAIPEKKTAARDLGRLLEAKNPHIVRGEPHHRSQGQRTPQVRNSAG
jgi:hypothetical protein